MANNYSKILELANANNMGLSNTIKRDFGIPLDFTSVQASYEAALNYAATNTLAYVGQPISVGDKLYIVTAESQGKYPAEVAEGESQIDVFLAEVGSATEGDGNTIDLKDGVLSLHGIDGKNEGTYVPSLVNGVLTWNKPDTTTVDGLTAAVEGLEVRAEALELTVNGREASEGVDAVEGLVDKVAANTQAIADAEESLGKAISDEADARAEAIKAVTDSIGDVAEGKTVVEMIADAESAAKAAIPTNVSSFTNDSNYQNADQVSTAISTAIAGKANSADVYTKGEVDTKIEGIENTIAGITHFTTKVVSSRNEVTEIGVLYLIKDETVTGTDKYNEYLFIEGMGAVLIGDTTTDLSDYVTNNTLATELAKYTTTEGLATVLASYAKSSDVETELGKKVNVSDYNTDKATFALEESVASRLAGKVDNATLANYYTSAEVDAKGYAVAEIVNTELAKKVETAQIRHTSEGVGEGVTKDGTALTITVDSYRKAEVYTKSETDNQIDAKIASVTGGESAADVKLALESYRDALNSEIWGASAASWTTTETIDGKTVVTYTPQYGTTSRVDTLEADVATLKTNVQTAQTTADNAAAAVVTLENGQVKTNKENIATLTTIINGADADDKNSLSYRIGALESANTSHATEYANLKAKVDTAIDTTIPAITARVEANEGAIVTINNTLGSQAALIATKANSADVYNKTEVDGFVATINADIAKKADAATTYTKTEVDTAISSAIGNIDNTAITNNSADIATLVGADKDENGRANKSIRAIAADEINTLIKAADPEGGKTIENINNLIAYVDENAGEIAQLITVTKANTDKLAGIDETVVKTIDAKIAAIPTYELPTASADKLGGIKTSTADNGVVVDENGVASVAKVNVNTLTQTTGDILILNGGSATV